jgi:hypothetical protein
MAACAYADAGRHSNSTPTANLTNDRILTSMHNLHATRPEDTGWISIVSTNWASIDDAGKTSRFDQPRQPS